MSVRETDRRLRSSSGVQSGRCRRGRRIGARRAAARVEDGVKSRHMGRTPHRGIIAAGAQPPGPRLPSAVRALESWRRTGEDRHRRTPRVLLHGRVGRMGQGGGECGSGAGHSPHGVLSGLVRPDDSHPQECFGCSVWIRPPVVRLSSGRSTTLPGMTSRRSQSSPRFLRRVGSIPSGLLE